VKWGYFKKYQSFIPRIELLSDLIFFEQLDIRLSSGDVADSTFFLFLLKMNYQL